jgi:hypothetical protein
METGYAITEKPIKLIATFPKPTYKKGVMIK